VIGGCDEQVLGLPVDPVSGDTTVSGQVLSAEALGATPLAMADVDPDEYVAGISPITAVYE
jgi:hypothetical protein